MFTIDISDLLISHIGDTREFEMEEQISAADFPDIVFTAPLFVSLRIVRQDYGVDVTFERLETAVTMLEDHVEDEEIYVYDVTRKFHLKKSLEDTDDIEYISPDMTIDLTNIIAQEIFIIALR